MGCGVRVGKGEGSKSRCECELGSDASLEDD